MTTARERLLAGIAATISTRPGTARVAVDGVDGVGKTTFAGELAALLPAAVHVSADGFHHPRAVRHRRGRDSPEGFWLDSYDHPAMLHNVLKPFAPGGDRRYRPASHDLATDDLLDLPWSQAPTGAVLVLDGLFLHRDELIDHWDFSVFLTAPFEVTVARMATRDGSHPDPSHPSVARYVQGQRLYFAACHPWDRADIVVDNSDLARPRIVTRQ